MQVPHHCSESMIYINVKPRLQNIDVYINCVGMYTMLNIFAEKQGSIFYCNLIIERNVEN